MEDALEHDWNWGKLVHYWSEEGRGILFLQFNSIQSNSTENWELDVFFAGITVLAYLVEDVYVSFGDILLLICAILLLVYVGEFQSRLNDISGRIAANGSVFQDSATPFNFEDLLEEFDQILQIVNGLNKVIGLLTFGLTLGSLPFFVTNFLNLLSPPNTFTLVRVLLYFIHLMVFIIVAAKVNKRVSQMEVVTLSAFFIEELTQSLGSST